MGDWWLEGNRQAGFLSAAELAACAVQSDELAACAVTPAKLAANAVETAKIANLNVTSEKLSATALSRVVAVPIPDLAKATNLSSDYVLWRPLQAAILQRVEAVFQSSWVLSTAQTDPVLDVFNNACSSAAQVSVLATDPPARGARTDFGTLACAVLGACTDLTFKLGGMTSCNDAPAMTILLHYISSA